MQPVLFKRRDCRARPESFVRPAPVAPIDTCQRFRLQADEMVCLATPEPFVAVGCWYDEFQQVEDDEVVDILQRVGAHSV